MPRQLTSATNFDNLRKEAKRWLKALRENDPEARDRMRRAHPAAGDSPVLRDVQHALACEYGMANWKELKEALQARPAGPARTQDPRGEIVRRFLECACPDHHVRGLPAHRMARHAAMRIVEQDPGIAHHSLNTAVVCGELEEVELILRDQPQLANAKPAPDGPDRSGAGGSYDFLTDLGGKAWPPLLYLCFTRLPLAKANDNAVAMARLLLDHGADPNAYFMAGDSHYTPLVGVIGEGEEGRPPHSHRDELARLLLEHGAEPYDGQVVYNIHFQGKILWWMRLMYEFSVQRGRRADWDDPEWHMLDQGGYGSGARWHLRVAVENNDGELTEWCMAHGANPNTPPESDHRFPQRSLYEHAMRLGHRQVADLLVRYGAVPQPIVLDAEEQFVDACLRVDRDEAVRLLALHPEYVQSPKAIFAAARQDRADVVAFLLELGTPLEVEDSARQRALHVAAANDAVNVAGLLIERGAEIDPYELNYNNTPLDFAVYHEYQRVVDLLRPHSRDVWSLTAIGDLERLREIIPSEPRLARVSRQTTPLFWLPEDENKALEIARVFLEHGADPSFRSKKDGSTAADIARQRGMHRVANLLDTASLAPAAQRSHQAAQDFVSASERDPAALQRLNEYYGRSFTFEDVRAEIWRRVYAFRERSFRVPINSLQLSEAQTIVAQDAGFGSWDALMAAQATGTPPPGAPYVVDSKENRISPTRRITEREWDELIGVMGERGITALDANGLMTDAALARVATLKHVTALNLSGSRELTDDSLQQLARMRQLEYLNLSGFPGGKLTDRGLEVLRHLPNLRTFEMTWQAGITDAGVAHLQSCERLERVDLMGSPTGDGAIAALQGKSNLRNFSTGKLVTDAGVALLHNFPRLKENSGDARLLIDGPFTNKGLATLAGLEGVSDLDLFWHVTGITSDAFAHLVHLENLVSLGCDGDLSDDTAMRHIAAIPRLRKLRAQESVATDDGFVALSRSQTLEGFWGRVCPNFGSRGFVAFSKMPALRSLGVGCKNVDDHALSALPHFPALDELTPIGMNDDAFRHVGRCERLRRLTCMYCRDTTDLATEHIAGLQLKYYYAGLTQISDRSLAILGRMSSLEEVEFYECKGVTDAGLVFLTGLPRLREVHLDGLPGVTFGGTKVFPAHVRVSYST
jgi:ankyrin repeat protein